MNTERIMGNITGETSMNTKRSFTLKELLVVIAVMGILSVILFPKVCQGPDSMGGQMTAQSQTDSANDTAFQAGF
jgi:prepilin-type N-terminal cleavage/methylation domain-containing protein